MVPTFLLVACLSIGILLILLDESSCFRRFARFGRALRPWYSLGPTGNPTHERAMSSALTTAVVAGILGVLLMIAVIVQLVQ